jgi:hypothetical protein
VTTTLGNSTCSANISPSERGSILWFDPRREHSSIPTAKSRGRRAQGLSRLAASLRPPEGLGLDWPEHGGTLDRLGLEAAGIRTSAALALIILAPSSTANPATAHKRPQCRRTRACKIVGKFKPLILGEVHTAGNTAGVQQVEGTSNDGTIA